MAAPRHSVPIRILALLLLLWVGVDIGAHGLLASDFAPLQLAGPSPRAHCGDTGVQTTPAPDHCFCHGVSLGAILPGLSVHLAAAGVVVPALASQVACGDDYPLDHPPQLVA
jgi:hypothetical protein